jgi:hypothetical protein
MDKNIITVIVGLFIYTSSFSQQYNDTLSIAWKEGYLDIHHIVTGSGDCVFSVMPDGTTMMVDAGDIGDRKFKTSGYPLTSTSPYPNESKTAGKWIVEYIKQVLPNLKNPVIDYALLTHYHDDHIGGITNSTKYANNGAYKLTGITEVGDLLTIKKLIDRNYPSNDFPKNLEVAYKKEPSIFLNLQRFIKYHEQQNNLIAEQLKVGSTEQIQLKYKKDDFPEFLVRGIKANGTIWSGKGKENIEYFSKNHFIIEIHDIRNKKLIDDFYNIINNNFTLEIINNSSRNPFQFEILNNFNDDEKFLMMSEGRPNTFEWLHLAPKV